MRISDWSSDVCSSDLQRTGAHPRSAGAQARARHHPRSKAGDRADEISDRRYRQERRACERAPAEGGGAMKRLIPSALPIVSAALALSACNQNTAAGNDREARVEPAPTPAPIMHAQEALQNVATAIIKPETMKIGRAHV